MTLNVSLSPVFAIRVKPGSRPAQSIPAYAQLSAGQVKTVSTNTVGSVAPPTPFQGTNLGSIGGGNYFCQGCAILNPYYGQWGAMVATGLTGHASHYYGTESYIAAFGSTAATWVRVTDPIPFGGNGEMVPPQTYYDDVTGEWKYTVSGSTDWFGAPWVGDHTRGHQVAVQGGTAGQGRLFYPKSGTSSATYRNWAHIFDCGVETGSFTYDRTKNWTIRATTVGPVAQGFGGGCWYEPDTNKVAYLVLDTTFQQNQIFFYDVSGSAPVLSSSRTFSPATFGKADGAVEYIASRKLAIAFWNTGPILFDRTVASGTIPSAAMTQWAPPPWTVDWIGVSSANRLVYSPVDGNFYVLNCASVWSPGGMTLWRYTPPVDFRTGISNAAAMAASGGGEASRWTNLTPSLTGDPLGVAGQTLQAWGAYNGLCWHNTFSCFAICMGTTNPIQLIKPPAAPAPG